MAICIASWNTAPFTELCVRSLHRTADVPFSLLVGDGGSTDGSRELLEDLERDGWLRLELTHESRHHSDWLDDWLARAPTRHVLFCDSDIEFLRDGWLCAMRRRAQKTNAAIVCAERGVDNPRMIEPVSGEMVHRVAGPSSWLVLVEVAPLRALGVSFGYRAVETNAVPEGKLLYDTAAYLQTRALEAGLRSSAMGRRFRRRYRHYEHASWGSVPSIGRIRRRSASDVVAARLRVARAAQPSPSPLYVAAQWELPVAGGH